MLDPVSGPGPVSANDGGADHVRKSARAAIKAKCFKGGFASWVGARE